MIPRARQRTAERRGGCLVKLFLLFAVVVAVGALAWMLFLPIWVTAEIRARTGFDASVASLSCNPFGGKFTVRGLVLSNPASFPKRDFVELREFVAEADVWTLFSDRIVVDALTVDVRRLTLVRRADGKSNAAVLHREMGGEARGVAPELGVAATKGSPPPATAPEPGRKFLIRRLALRFDQLVIVDYSGGAPAVQEFNLGLDQRYENVTEAKQLVVPEVLRKVASADLGPILGRFVPGEVGRALGAAAREAATGGTELLKGAGQRANDLLKGMREKLEETKKP